MNKSVSEELFYDLYIKMSNKIEESTETIFSGTGIKFKAYDAYQAFMESSYSKQFFLDESTYEKNKTIKLFIESEILSPLFTKTYDALIAESSDGHLSFSQELLMENTQEQFNVRYRGSSNHEAEQFEEGAFWAGAATLASAFVAVPVPITVFAAMTYLGVNLLLPARYANSSDTFVEKYLGLLGKAMFNTKSLLAWQGTSLDSSNKNIINFDNVDVNPEVKKLFNSLSRTSDKKAPINGLNTIVAPWVDANDVFDNADPESIPDKGYLSSMFKPQYHNVFSVFIESVFKDSSGDKEKTNALIRYRKCLSDKLVDMYKFLMIANVSQSREYKKILRVMHKGFHQNPEQLLSFIHVDSEVDSVNKENIITLIKFRMLLDDLAKDLGKGAFEVDKESSIFLKQRLKQVDSEIEDYLARNKKQLETSFEDQNDFNRKEFKHKKPEDRNFKRKLFDR